MLTDTPWLRPVNGRRVGDVVRGGKTGWVIEAPIGRDLAWVKGTTSSGVPVLTFDRREATYWSSLSDALAWGEAHLSTTRRRGRWSPVQTRFPK